MPVAVSSNQSLYSRDIVTFHRGADVSAADAHGFVRTLAARYRREAECERSGTQSLPGIPPEWTEADA